MKNIIIIICCLCLWTCNTSDKEVKVVEEVVSPFAYKDDISKLVYTDFILDTKAQKDIESWNKFFELETIMADLKSGDVSYFQGYTKTLLAFMNDLRDNIPDAINSPSIQARFLTLETKMLKLQSILSLKNIPKSEELQIIKETLIAYSNLNLQINKKYEKDSQQIEKP